MLECDAELESGNVGTGVLGVNTDFFYWTCRYM